MSLEDRVTAIEEQLGMESGLRASMDDDLSSVNSKVAAMNHLLQALSITQGEHTREFAKVREAQVKQTAALDQIIGMLGTLIDREDGDEQGQG